MSTQKLLLYGSIAVVLIGGIFLFLFRSSKYDRQEEFINGFAIVVKDGKYGLINEQEEEIISPQYESVTYFVGEYARITEQGKVGFVNKKGQLVIKPKYDKVYGFNGPYAKVKLGDKLGLINREAEEVIAPRYDAVNYNIIGGFFEVALNGEVNRLDKSQVLENAGS